MGTQLYLLAFDPAVGMPAKFDPQGDAHPLADHLWLVRSELSRSKLYHKVKWQLDDGAALLVAPLAGDKDGWPKFKGMEAGALAWLRGG